MDSFIQFVNHAHKCTTSTSYAAMATQAIRLIEELKDAHGDKDTLGYKMVTFGAQNGKDPLRLSVPLDGVFKVEQPTLEFTPASGSQIMLSAQGCISIAVSLKVQGLPIVLLTPHKGYTLDVKTRHRTFVGRFIFLNTPISTSVNLLQSQALSWEIVAQLPTERLETYDGEKITISCSMAGNMEIKPSEVTYTMNHNHMHHTAAAHGSKPAETDHYSEHLYHNIYKMHPVVTGKITGTAVT